MAAKTHASKAALPSDTGSTGGARERMLAEQGPWVAATLRGLAAGPGARAALAAHLPDTMLSRLVTLLRPGLAALPPRPGSTEPDRQRHWREALAAAVCKRAGTPGPAAAVPHPAPAQQAVPGVPAREPDPLPEGERLALLNAGMVLMAPYLPRLFGVLGLVADGAFTDTAAAERAALLLQFAVTGVASAPEYQLPLNKLMCGLAAEAPLPLAIEVTEQERATLASLLEAMIATWSALGHTSIDGFRHAFLVRQGELLRGEEDWSLSVAPGPFDMLMDRLPWSFSIIRYPWMKQPIHVTWQRT
ncbi:contractile injection system tape measure protein [Pseudoduganella armeniaca]|uniref:Uncharacterized protein n=1 Tax=Pseudoduganella armeniaca TaxID=2072590 RepID=A0A2R4CBU3_9BURK|nr:contractile injection system tape measure protein [Pseudoduganella armeniaca]AVR97111.1 hypothetical protein C9I28_16765 [Pseudoduganella armeniaca]